MEVTARDLAKYRLELARPPVSVGGCGGKYRWQIVVRVADPRALLADMVFPLS